MLSTSPHAKVRLLAVALLATLGLGLAGTTHAAKAASLADIFAACNNWGDTPVAKLSPAATDLTLLCLIDKERHKAGRSYLAINFPLGRRGKARQGIHRVAVLGQEPRARQPPRPGHADPAR
jgi:hypothetical protein